MCYSLDTSNRYFLGGKETAKEPYLLTGKLFCGHCGTEMVAGGGKSKTGKQYYYYECKKKKKKLLFFTFVTITVIITVVVSLTIIRCLCQRAAKIIAHTIKEPISNKQ